MCSKWVHIDEGIWERPPYLSDVDEKTRSDIERAFMTKAYY